MKGTKRGQVFEILDKQGYILDQQAVDILGEKGCYTACEHVRIWKKLRTDQDYFKNDKIIEKRKGHRCHMIRIEGMAENSWYKVGKEFYDSIDI